MGGKKKKEKLAPHAARVDFGAFPRWKPEHGVVKKSMMSIQHAGKSTRSGANVTWGKAASCKLFRKKIDAKAGKAPKTNKNGVVMDERPNRAFGAHFFKAVASGAAGALGAEFMVQSELMRCKTDPEHDVYPALPQIMPGAAVQMEWCGIGYMQEVHGVAKRLKEVGGHEKITPRCAQAACDIVNKKINAGTGFMPLTVMATFAKPKAKKAKKGEADATANDS